MLIKATYAILVLKCGHNNGGVGGILNENLVHKGFD